MTRNYEIILKNGDRVKIQANDLDFEVKEGDVTEWISFSDDSGIIAVFSAEQISYITSRA